MIPKLEDEILQGKIIKHRAEEIWGWASPAGQARAQRRALLIAEWAGMKASDEVLEIGCGSGLFTEKIARTGAKITATDLSDDLLDLTRRKGIPNCRIERADAHRLQFPDASFNIVFGSSILHHLDVDRALTEVRRVLKPQGRLIFVEPNMMNPQILAQKNIPFLKRWLHDTPDETAFLRWDMARKLKSRGFVDVAVRPHEFLHPSVPQKLIPFVQALSGWMEKLPILKEIAGSLLIYAVKP